MKIVAWLIENGSTLHGPFETANAAGEWLENCHLNITGPCSIRPIKEKPPRHTPLGKIGFGGEDWMR